MVQFEKSYYQMMFNESVSVHHHGIMLNIVFGFGTFIIGALVDSFIIRIFGLGIMFGNFIPLILFRLRVINSMKRLLYTLGYKIKSEQERLRKTNKTTRRMVRPSRKRKHN